MYKYFKDKKNHIKFNQIQKKKLQQIIKLVKDNFLGEYHIILWKYIDSGVYPSSLMMKYKNGSIFWFKARPQYNYYIRVHTAFVV